MKNGHGRTTDKVHGIPKRLGHTLALVALVSTLSGPSLAAGLDLLFERTLMMTADQGCNLFTPEVSSTLDAARAQARNAGLRSGVSRADIEATEGRARDKALQTPCKSPDLAIAAARVRQAFRSDSQTLKHVYSGDHASWIASRVSRAGTISWQVSQDIQQAGNHMVLGLAGHPNVHHLIGLIETTGRESPYGARLILRDDTVTLGPYLDVRSQSLAQTSLSRLFPPEAGQIGYVAVARSRAGRDLLKPGMTGGWAFRFPPEAIPLMANLDPREAFAVDLLFPEGAAHRIYFEVGDFAAGRAFVTQKPR